MVCDYLRQSSRLSDSRLWVDLAFVNGKCVTRLPILSDRIMNKPLLLRFLSLRSHKGTFHDRQIPDLR